MEEKKKVLTRIDHDESGPRTRYEEIVVGGELGSLEWEVTEEDIAKQCLIDDDYCEWYVSDDTPWGGQIAPPQVNYRPPRWLLSRNYNIRGVFYKWEMENYVPLKPGMKVKVSGRIKDKWIKHNKEFVSYEVIGEDMADGTLLFRTVRAHALDVIDRDAPRAGEGVDSGPKPEKI